MAGQAHGSFDEHLIFAVAFVAIKVLTGFIARAFFSVFCCFRAAMATAVFIRSLLSVCPHLRLASLAQIDDVIRHF